MSVLYKSVPNGEKIMELFAGDTTEEDLFTLELR